MATLTRKAEQTRQLILNTSLELFAQRGYETATMREIAAAANVSLGLAYRYFKSKESLVLALYQQMAEPTDSAVSALPSGTIADRFIATMNARLNSARPYRKAFSALFSAMMTPGADTEILGAGAREMRGISERTFINLVQNSKDAVKSTHTRDFGKLIHSIHFAQLLVEQAHSEENAVINAIGPETFTYRGLVERMREILRVKRLIISVSPGIGYLAGRIIGKWVGDVTITQDEITGLMSDLLHVDAPAAGKTKLTEWARMNAETLGRDYASALSRRHRSCAVTS